MADFSRSEYASYVQLCRELRLEREWRDGDWCWCSTHQDPVGFICLNYDWQDPIDRTQMPDFWLPALADWVEMLRVVGLGQPYSQVTIEYLPESPEDPKEIGVSLGGVVGLSPTEEEAFARLYVALTQTPAGPSPPSAAR